MDALNYLLILVFSSLITWAIYDAERKTRNQQRGFIYDSNILPYSLPFFILALAVLALLFYRELLGH